MSSYVIHLRHRKGEGMWHLEHEGRSIGAFNTKGDGVVAGHTRGRRLQESGTDTALAVHHEDGSIESEYTYGNDAREILELTARGIVC